MELDRRTLKRIENLSHFCDFDMEKGIATVLIKFDSVDEIIEPHKSVDEKIIIKDEAIQLVYDNICIIPKDFKVKYSISIKDLNGYDANYILNCFESAINNLKVKEKRVLYSKQTLMKSFIFIGMILLFVFIIYKHIGKTYIEPVPYVILLTLMDIFYDIILEEGVLFFILKCFYREKEDIDKKRFIGLNIV